MKRTPLIFFLLLGITLCAQTEQPNLGLIPTPQRVEVDGKQMSGWDLSKSRIVEKKVDSLPVECNLEQAYRLEISRKKVTLYYVGEEGLQNARLTLDQLMIVHPQFQHATTITDWPAYRYRGWMDDQSRGPVPHKAFRTKQWETLHALKYNFCNYYTEHTLYQKNFPDLAPASLADCTPLPDEVINLQLLAHAEKTLRIPFYQNLMDSRANFNPGNPMTYKFLRRRIQAAIGRIPQSPFFIINCDETEQLGSGRARRLVDSLGAEQVYVNHINRCCELIDEIFFLTHHGQLIEDGEAEAPRVVMWGDIVAKNPAMMKQLPAEMTYIMWAYEPLDSYDRLVKPFKEQGNPFWVAPSLSHSSNMIPNPYRYMKNIANLARDGYRNGAEGLMNTCWDDNGEALFDNCWHGLFWSAEMAWNPIRTNDPEEFRRREEQFNQNFARLFYGDTSLANVKTLYKMGGMESDADLADWYNSAALMEPLLNFNPDNTSDEMDERIASVEQWIESFQFDSAANPHTHYAVERIKLTCKKNHLREMIYEKLYGPYWDGSGVQIVKTLTKEYLRYLFLLKREYLRLWDQENGEYERHIVCDRYDALAREVLELDRHVFVEVSSDTIATSGTSTTSSTSPTVKLRTLWDDKPIYYTLDGSEPTEASTLYTEPFPLERSATIKAIAYNEYGEGVITEQYLLSHLGMGAKTVLLTPFSTYKAIYSGGGENALTDGIQGSNTTYADGHWQGYWGDSIDAVIDFGKPTAIHKVSMRFMQNTFDWILAPKEIKVYASNDGKDWHLVADQHFGMDPRETGMRLKHYSIDMMEYAMGKIVLGYPLTRFLRVVVPNPGPLPDWHPAPGQPSYLFADEIVIE